MWNFSWGDAVEIPMPVFSTKYGKYVKHLFLTPYRDAEKLSASDAEIIRKLFGERTAEILAKGFAHIRVESEPGDPAD